MTYQAGPIHFDQHREGLKQLWAELGIDDHENTRMRWFYERYPLGEPTTCVVESKDTGQIVACATAIPRPTSVFGTVLQAGWLADFAVAKAHRSAGAAMAVQRAVARETVPGRFQFIYGHPNPNSNKLFQRLKYKQIGTTTTWVKPLRSHGTLSRYVHPSVASLIAPAVDAGLNAADWALGLGSRGRFAVEECTRADARFDLLWERGKPDALVVTAKGSGYLNWRYADHTSQRYRFFCLSDRCSGELVGYAVYSIGGGKAFLADMFAIDLGSSLRSVLVEFVAWLRGHGLASLWLSYLGSQLLTTHLTALHFVRREGSRGMIVHISADAPETLRTTILDSRNWFMFDGELDI